VEDAERIRREAEEYAAATRRRADAFAEARIERIRELTDRLVATAETLDRRFGEAASIKEQLDDLVAALAAAARRVAEEAEPPPSPAPSRAPGPHVEDARRELS
jgi:hypothetical protein